MVYFRSPLAMSGLFPEITATSAATDAVHTPHAMICFKGITKKSSSMKGNEDFIELYGYSIVETRGNGIGNFHFSHIPHAIASNQIAAPQVIIPKGGWLGQIRQHKAEFNPIAEIDMVIFSAITSKVSKPAQSIGFKNTLVLDVVETLSDKVLVTLLPTLVAYVYFHYDEKGASKGKAGYEFDFLKGTGKVAK